jgi:hypothetical protein
MTIASGPNFPLWARLRLGAFGDTGVVGHDSIGSVHGRVNLDQQIVPRNQANVLFLTLTDRLALASGNERGQRFTLGRHFE